MQPLKMGRLQVRQEVCVGIGAAGTGVTGLQPSQVRPAGKVEHRQVRQGGNARQRSSLSSNGGSLLSRDHLSYGLLYVCIQSYYIQFLPSK